MGPRPVWRTIVPIVDLISILHDLGEFGSATPLPLMMTRLWHAGATVRRMSPGDERALSGPADLLPGAAIIQRAPGPVASGRVMPGGVRSRTPGGWSRDGRRRSGDDPAGMASDHGRDADQPRVHPLGLPPSDRAPGDGRPLGASQRIAGQRDNRDGRIEPLQRERIQSCVLGAADTDLTAGASAVLEPTRYLVDGSRR